MWRIELGGKMIELDSINGKQSMKEFVNWNKKSADEEVSEGYPETFRRMGSAFVPWHLHHLTLEQSHAL
jgi:hypothetical protein